MFVTEKAFGEVSTPVKVKLSWAIREGAKLRSQCHGAMFRHGGSCAIGAAYEALGGQYEGWGESNSMLAYGSFLRKIQQHLDTMCGPIKEELFGQIITMNDRDYMTREAIADYLEENGL